MTDETGSPAGIEAMSLPADAPEAFESTEAAAAYFTELRSKPDKKPAESAEPATAEEELPEKANSAPETDPAEKTEETDPVEEPPIERPRSWAKELDEEWASYPREAQEKIAKREQERDTAIRRSQNEAAEARKAAEAARETAEKARQQYEAQLPALMERLQAASQASFSDIKTMDDVRSLQRDDPFRFQAWQVHQMDIQAAKVEVDRINNEKAQAQQSEWATHVQKENQLASEFIPDLADKVKGPALTQRVATELLPELGFNDSELADLANGKAKLSIYDHRIQRLLADSLKLRDIQSAPKAVAAKSLPPVQKPGISRPANASVSEREQALIRQLNETGDLSAAQELRALQTRRRA